MGITLLEGLTKSLALAVLSEIGDRTFCAAVMMAMHHPWSLVFAGCLVSSVAMTIISALLGWAAPSMISRKWAHHITTILFVAYGLWSLWEGITEDGEAEELAEIEEELVVLMATATGAKESSKEDEDLKKQQRPFLTQLFSPIFLKAFSITFFGEWGDKSQMATIGLASDENPFGVVLGGVIGQASCIIAAVIGGKGLATKISERMVALSSGILFLAFGVQSFLSPIEQ